MDSMLANLNAEQLTAVKTTEGPVLVLSGAGTGKTRVLTTRVAYILNNGLAQPWQVLALTFTNKAANEMKSRIATFAESGAGWNARDLWCGTFHSICLRILRANAAVAGLRPDFIIFGEDDQKSVVKSVLADMGTTTRTPGDFVEQFSAIKDKGLSALDNKDKVYVAYNAELARMGAIDFGDIILYVLKLFESQPEILARYPLPLLRRGDRSGNSCEFIAYIYLNSRKTALLKVERPSFGLKAINTGNHRHIRSGIRVAERNHLPF